MAQRFKRITKSGDLVNGAHYILAGRYKSVPDSLVVIASQEKTGNDVKRREGKMVKPETDGSICVTDGSIAVFELCISGTTYSFKDVALDAYLAYSTAVTTTGNTALYTMTDEEIEAVTTSKVKYSKGFSFKSVSSTDHKSSFITKEKIDGKQYALSPRASDRYFRLFEKASYQDSLYLYIKEEVAPTVERSEKGDWTFTGDWTAEELYSIDFSSAKRIDFTGMILPACDGKDYDGLLPEEYVWTYVRKGTSDKLPEGWCNIIEVEDKDASVQGEAVTDIYGDDRTTLGPKYSFTVPQDLRITWCRDVSADEGYYTIGLPFTASHLSWEAADGLPCEVERMKYESVNDDEVVFVKDDATEKWMSGTAYLWRPKERRSGAVCFSAYGVDVAAPDLQEDTLKDGLYANISERAIETTGNFYLLGMDGMNFVKAAAGSKIAPCRAFLILNNPSQIDLRIIQSGHQTKIENLKTDETYKTYYTPSGVKLGRLKTSEPLPGHWPNHVISVSH